MPARAAVADGITTIAATPHVREDYPTTTDAMESGVRQLRAALEREGIDLELLPGGEVSLEQLDRLSHDELRRFGLGGNPKYLLIETPYSDWPLPFGEIVLRLGSFGMTPVIAHPERNSAIQADLAKLVDDGLVHMVGSDAHTAGIREVGLSGARKVIGDERLAHWLTEAVPAAIVRDEPLP